MITVQLIKVGKHRKTKMVMISKEPDPGDVHYADDKPKQLVLTLKEAEDLLDGLMDQLHPAEGDRKPIEIEITDTISTFR